MARKSAGILRSAGVVVGVGGWSALVVADVVGLYELEGSVLKVTFSVEGCFDGVGCVGVEGVLEGCVGVEGVLGGCVGVEGVLGVVWVLRGFWGVGTVS